MKHPEIAEAWSKGRSSVTGKKEGKARNKGLPMHKRMRKRKHMKLETGKYY